MVSSHVPVASVSAASDTALTQRSGTPNAWHAAAYPYASMSTRCAPSAATRAAAAASATNVSPVASTTIPASGGGSTPSGEGGDDAANANARGVAGPTAETSDS